MNLENLQNEIISCLEELFPNYFISLQDGLPCHRGRKFQNFLKEKLNSRLVENFEWPPNSPDCNSLDYFFWDKLQQKPYEGRHCKPFPSIQELFISIQELYIIEVWDECTTELHTIRKL